MAAEKLASRFHSVANRGIATSSRTTAPPLPRCSPSILARRYIGFKEKITPVKLSFDVTQPNTTTTSGQCLVICHGLL